MPSGKNLDQVLMPTFCFGDISRDEINLVLNNAGVSLAPPIKTPFVTGIQPRKRTVVINTPTYIEPKQAKVYETVYVERLSEEEDLDIVPIKQEPIVKQENLIKEVPVKQELPIKRETPIKKEPPTKREINRLEQPTKPLQKPTSTQSQPTPLVASSPVHTKTTLPAVASPKTAASVASIPKTSQPVSSKTTPTVVAPAKPPVQTQPVSTTAVQKNTIPTGETPVTPTKSASGTTVGTEPPTPQPKTPISSWASLLKKSDVQKTQPTQASPTPNGVATNGKPQTAKPVKPASPTPSVVPKFTGVADIISKYEPTYSSPLIQPRGLINNVNTCFMNVILQPLSHCAPFYNLIKSISTHAVHSIKSKTPLLDSIVEFINEFANDRPDNKNQEPYGEPFVPEYVYNALRGQKKFDTLRGRQEDSEEFLCYLLDGLHEEMTAVLKEQYDKKEAEAKANGDESWLEVGAKNKTSNLRSTGFDESPISRIFGGKIRSVLRCPGAKDSINLEPYQSLPLDIQPENVHSIEDAIKNMTLPETMHDYTSPKGIKVDATKQVYLESLPPVLILHMKRFVFDNVGGVQKLSKRVQYGSRLTIDPEWMSRPSESTSYKLFGCVYHHGTSAGGGHYTCDIQRRNGEWLHIDDTNITSVSEQDVLVTEDNTRTSEKLNSDQTAYILFYVKSP